MKTFQNFPDVIFNHYFLIGSLFIGYLMYRTLHSLLRYDSLFQIKFKLCRHSWRSILCNKSIPYNNHCTSCGKLMLEHDEGLFCDSCGVSSCKNCQRTLDRKLKCKYVTWNIDKPFPHLWANVGVFEDNAQSPDLEANKKYFCSWCQRTIRSTESVIQSNVECCDFQKYKNIIIPPPNVKLDKNKLTRILEVTKVVRFCQSLEAYLIQYRYEIGSFIFHR
ncbi:unnamed protein product [Leptidea sinapis]|uniref:Phorbol-ester/DAG-type domain-containing protein n=3 Tax=Leptidea sinapis TaxID=189913 RepID=A0A5E4Q619_9NEOP|nr:unnamed protein product [Leptidea sinapis]